VTRRGVSLLEVTVAAALMGIVLLAVVELLPSSTLSLQHAEDLEAATAYGLYMLDDARTYPEHLLTAPDVELDVTVARSSWHVVRHAVDGGNGLADVVVTLSARHRPPITLGTRVSVDAR
jgi:prepilin-type N-terminal cleavage/methylation domain-containing protein